MVAPVIIAAAVSAVASLIGAAVAAGDNAKAQALRQKALDEYGEMALPQIDRLVARQLPPDAAARYLKSTQATEAQGEALEGLRGVVREKGETPEDRAAYLRMAQQIASQSAGAQGGILRDMRARGLSGSGVEYALRNKGAQSAINRGNETAIGEAASARQRHLGAISQLGTLGSQVRGQELSALQAQDAINIFNTNATAEADRWNAGISQREFNNKLALAQAKANAAAGVSSGLDASADATRQTAGGIGQAGMTVAGAFGESLKKKKDDK